MLAVAEVFQLIFEPLGARLGLNLAIIVDQGGQALGREGSDPGCRHEGGLLGRRGEHLVDGAERVLLGDLTVEARSHQR